MKKVHKPAAGGGQPKDTAQQDIFFYCRSPVELGRREYAPFGVQSFILLHALPGFFLKKNENELGELRKEE